LEAAGFSTVMVSMMPFFAELAGTPRTLAVEFPFAQTMGHDAAQQMRVVRQALAVLATAVSPAPSSTPTRPGLSPKKKPTKPGSQPNPHPLSP
jgi:hypothetical protein